MPEDVISDDVLYNISYLIFFFGVGLKNSPLILDVIDSKYNGFFQSVEECVKGTQTLWRTERAEGRKIAVSRENDVFELDLGYIPCNGHTSILSHYVRHLFQLVKYVDDADSKYFDDDVKYDYIATLRSQLSTYEQLLLFYNAVSVLGKPWLEAPNYLKKYCVVKSIPLPLADFYKLPLTVLGEANDNGKVMFEWTEIKKRLKTVG